MTKLELDYYKKYLDYEDFKTKQAFVQDLNNISDLKQNKQLKNALNINFVYIAIWQAWIKEPNTSWYANAPRDKKNFNVIDLFPFHQTSGPSTGNTFDRMPIVDFSDFITIINGGNENQILKKIMSADFAKILSNKNKKNPRVDFYIDRAKDKITEATSGCFIEVLDSFGLLPDEFLVKIKDVPPKVLYTNSDNVIPKNIKIITDKFTATTEAEYLQRELLIEDTCERIVKIIQSFIGMYTELYNFYNESINKTYDPATALSSSGIIDRANIGSLPIERSLMLAKPPIVPAFKKSYVVRENNLKPYVTIKMLYYANEGEDDPIEINNFDIPYNSILTMEHNIKEHNMTITMIDTQGIISEILIQKMYVVSQKKTNSRKIESTGLEYNPEKPYFFMVEYGWAGPETEDEDELIEENVFVKSSNRGFIKSISSQFSFKGNEYTLTITPNDQENINRYMNNYDLVYFPAKVNNNSTVSIVTGLMALFLILDDPNKNEIKRKAAEARKNEFQYLFEAIEDASLEQTSVRRGNPPVATIRYVFKHNTGYLLNADVDSYRQSEGKEIHEIIRTMYGDSVRTGNKIKLSDIKYVNENNRMESLRKACQSASFSLNAWIVGLYVIWKMKKYFKAIGEKFVFFDASGVFDVFANDEVVSGETEGECLGMLKVMEIFNPLCMKKETAQNYTFEQIFDFVEDSIKHSKNLFNQFELEKIMDTEPDEGDQKPTDPRALTLFTSQIISIFGCMKNIGMNVSEESKGTHASEFNMYLGSDGIFADFNSVNMQMNSSSMLKKEYKRRIFGDKHNIFSLENDNKTYAEKRSSVAYNKFLKALGDEDDVKEKVETRKNEIKAAEIKANKAFKDAADTVDNKKLFPGIKEQIMKTAEESISKLNKLRNEKMHILYLAYKTNPNKVAFLNCSLPRKLSLLGRQMVQSYSFTPKMVPTRNSNRQFFNQGNSLITKEGTGDIIEFSIDPVDIGNFNSLMLSNKNKNNIGFTDFSSNMSAGNIYTNASKYYRTYRDIDGKVSKENIAKDIANLDLNYQSQTNLKGSITIIGEPYWSNINLVFSTCIYIHVYYANGERSSHSGLYYVSNAVQNISDGKFTTKLEITRAPTFLSSLEKLSNKNKYVG